MMRTILAATLAIASWGCLALAQTTIDGSSSGVVGPGGRQRSSKDIGKPIPKPASKPAGKPGKNDPPKKYAVPTETEIAQSKALQAALFEKAKKVNPNLRTVETPHFVIYSGLKPNEDKGLQNVMERMYKTLCAQFDVAENETVWVGKCAIYLLTSDEQFFSFVKNVDGLPEAYNKAAGYFRSTAIQSYIVMRPPQGKDLDGWLTTLVHESTHAFLFRFISDKQVPLWLNEGIADTSAASVMNSKGLAYRLKIATKEALKGQSNAAGVFEMVKSVFDGVKLEQFDYGIAQSWAQFLIARDKKAFIKFVTMLKEGKSETDALKECYKWTRKEMVQAWATIATRNLR